MKWPGANGRSVFTILFMVVWIACSRKRTCWHNFLGN
jgi:hypothetical protein